MRRDPGHKARRGRDFNNTSYTHPKCRHATVNHCSSIMMIYNDNEDNSDDNDDWHKFPAGDCEPLRKVPPKRLHSHKYVCCIFIST